MFNSDPFHPMFTDVTNNLWFFSRLIQHDAMSVENVLSFTRHVLDKSDIGHFKIPSNWLSR